MERADIQRVVSEVRAAGLTIRKVWEAFKEGKRVELTTTGRNLSDAIADTIIAKPPLPPRRLAQLLVLWRLASLQSRPA